MSGTERPRFSLPPGTLTLRDYRSKHGSVRIRNWVLMRFTGRALSHLLEPLEGIGGEVVPLRVAQDVLGQGREDSLEIGTLGSRSHNEAIGRDVQYPSENSSDTKAKTQLPFPRGGSFGLFGLFALFALPAVAARLFLSWTSCEEQRCARDPAREFGLRIVCSSDLSRCPLNCCSHSSSRQQRAKSRDTLRSELRARTICDKELLRARIA